MADLANEITITKDSNGKFKLATDTGNVINFSETELILVLEEVVNQFRGNRVGLTTRQTQPAPSPAPKPSVSTTSTTGNDRSETHYNGGIGPRIGTFGNNGLGL